MGKKIVLTGGGTAGHVTPNLALIPELKKAGYDITYIGSYDGIEKKLIADFGIPYYGVSTGKLRRYLDPKNFSDPFRIMKGFAESRKLLKKIKPDIIFSKGGFVSVPVIRAASTLTEGSRSRGMEMCGFTDDKPVILVIGGSQGAGSINKIVRSTLPKLLNEYQVIHICGKDKMDNLLLNKPGYAQFEFLKEGLKDAIALSDIVVSRAGANSICELLALRKPNLLIPLPASASRGDQLLNAASFEKQGFSMVLHEEDLDEKSFMNALAHLYENRQTFIDAMNKSDQMQPTLTIMKLIEECSK